MYLAGNYCYRINAIAPPGGAEDVDVLVFVIGVHESMDSRRCSYLHDL